MLLASHCYTALSNNYDMKAVKSEFAVGDIAAVQFTSGEAEALHSDVNKTMTGHDELEARIITLERQVKELQE
jgi:hypothetical protein